MELEKKINFAPYITIFKGGNGSFIHKNIEITN